MSEQFDASPEVRQAGRSVLDRLQSDGEFRAALEADPVAVLNEAGIPSELMADLLVAAGVGEGGDDVEGFGFGFGGVADCSITSCSGLSMMGCGPGKTDGKVGGLNRIGRNANTLACSPTNWY